MLADAHRRQLVRVRVSWSKPKGATCCSALRFTAWQLYLVRVRVGVGVRVRVKVKVEW